MREIKFRGLRTDGKGWVYGFLIKNEKISGIIPEYEITYACNGSALDFGYIEVTPESVGQSTGLKDKNGKDIYEGDFLHSNAYHKTWIVDFTPCDGLKLAIKYEDDFKLEGIVQTHEDWRYNKVSTCEVIGNIHENNLF